MLFVMSIAFGAVVGFSLGLTGSGGSIFAVPLLVYGLAVAPRDAVGVSLAAVGITALVGAGQRWRRGEVDVRTGLLFAVAGMIGAPAGAWIADSIPPNWLLLSFAGVMLVVAVRMWRSGTRSRMPAVDRREPPERYAGGSAAPRPRLPDARLETEAPDEPHPAVGDLLPGRDGLESTLVGRGLLLGSAGLATGVFSGLFGVGGGIVIVPALVFVTGMAIHRAVATSLLVIALVSPVGVASHLVAGSEFALSTAAAFVVGGVLGMFGGTLLGRRIPGIALQKVFAVAVVAVAAFVITKNLV